MFFSVLSIIIILIFLTLVLLLLLLIYYYAFNLYEHYYLIFQSFLSVSSMPSPLSMTQFTIYDSLLYWMFLIDFIQIGNSWANIAPLLPGRRFSVLAIRLLQT